MNTTERFLKYVSFPTMSDESSETVPSSEKQLALSRYLADELNALGLSNVELDSKGYLVMAGAGGLASYRGKYYKSI